MWMAFHNVTTRVLAFPYKTNSPTLKKVITYDEAELWNEVDRIMAEDTEHKYTVGTNLYYNLLLCSDVNYWLDLDTNFYLEEYMAMKRFNIPLALSMDDVDYERLVVFSAIDEEYNACMKAKKNE
jgi:hypothetical protein